MTRTGRMFLGYLRVPTAASASRNHVLVVPTVICASVVAERIAASIAPIGAALPHLAGCGQLGPDMRVTHETLAAYCAASERRRRASSSRSAASRSSRSTSPTPRGRRASRRRSSRSRARAAPSARPRAASRSRAQLAADARRASSATWCPASSLVLSVKCGGSDYTSGLASNPALGRVADRLVDLGGAAVLGEIAEIMGAEHLLAARASRPRAGRAAAARRSAASKPKRWRSASTSAARSRRPATSAAA